MNSVNLTGRLTRDPELKYAQNGTAFANFALAVNRHYNRNEADFIDCVAFGKTAETVANHLTKGQQIGVSGSLQIDNYTRRDGSKGKAARVVVAYFDFLSAKPSGLAVERDKDEWGSLASEINVNTDLPL